MSKFIINISIDAPLSCVDVEKEFLRMLARRNKIMYIQSMGIVNVDDPKDTVGLIGPIEYDKMVEEKIKNES